MNEKRFTQKAESIRPLPEASAQPSFIMTTTGIRLIKAKQRKKLCLQILGSITIDCRNGKIDPMTEAFLTMAGVFAQLELSMIRERVKSGMENARAKGKVIGRPVLTRDALPDVFYKHYPLLKNGTLTKKEFSQLIGVSRPTLDKYLNIAEGED